MKPLRSSAGISVVASAMIVAACTGPSPQPVEARRAERVARPATTAPAAPATTVFRLPAVERLVAIGDLHGDFEATKQVFALAGATDAEGRWVGGRLVVVQTGDQLDRGDGEREILDFLDRVKGEAEAAGGALHILNGNHEIMNVAGDFRYVTPGARHAFDDVFPRASSANAAPEDLRGRAGAFLPGGGTARRLAARPVILQVGDTVFAHAGVTREDVAFGIDRINRETSAWMRGERPAPPSRVHDQEGPVWTRRYGADAVPAAVCAALADTLRALSATRLVVGHTVMDGGVSTACDGALARIDVGLSRAYGSGPIAALEITASGARALSAPRHTTN